MSLDIKKYNCTINVILDNHLSDLHYGTSSTNTFLLGASSSWMNDNTSRLKAAGIFHTTESIAGASQAISIRIGSLNKKNNTYSRALGPTVDA